MIFNKAGILHCVQDDEIEILRVVRESMRHDVGGNKCYDKNLKRVDV